MHLARRWRKGDRIRLEVEEKALGRAITGIDTDRLKEEKKRGITIELGFASLDLPSGLHVGIVDVPGHEKFVKNMVAGATGIDIVAMVIAADEGVMPQTREHMEICSLLGVKHGMVVLTKIDMVDEEWLELVTEDISDFTVKYWYLVFGLPIALFVLHRVLMGRPGRYRFADFPRVGALLTLLIFVLAVVLVPVIWPL